MNVDPSQLTDEQKKELEEKLKNMTPDEIRELQKQQCIFCQIVSGKVPSKKIYEDDKTIVILDIYPAVKGHAIVLPKEHFAIMPQVPNKELGHFFSVAKAISHIFLRSLKATGSNVFVANGALAGQKAPHFMIHVIPRKEGDGLLAVEDKIVPPEVLANVETVVKEKLNSLMGKEVLVDDKGSSEESDEQMTEESKEESEDSDQKTADDAESKSDDDDIDLEALFGPRTAGRTDEDGQGDDDSSDSSEDHKEEEREDSEDEENDDGKEETEDDSDEESGDEESDSKTDGDNDESKEAEQEEEKDEGNEETENGTDEESGDEVEGDEPDDKDSQDEKGSSDTELDDIASLFK